MKHYYYSPTLDELGEFDQPYEFEGCIRVKFEGDFEDYLKHKEDYTLDGKMFVRKDSLKGDK